jgi:hypothetical protein
LFFFFLFIFLCGVVAQLGGILMLALLIALRLRRLAPLPPAA